MDAEVPLACGIVTGLRAEARVARLASDAVAVGGGTPSGARAAAERLVAEGAAALMSFGLAGGLDPACAAGALLVPQRVVSAGGVWHADATLLARCGGATIEALFAGQKIAATVVEKSSLYRLTGAAGIDLESGEVASVAAAHGLPFVVLRAVCDPADRDLPPAALAALDNSGVIGLSRVLASLLAHPSQLLALRRLASDAAKARATLRSAASAFR